MNKKGFTLVELMAVIILIAVVSFIAVVSLNGVKRKSELKLIESNFDLIVTSGVTYGEDHSSSITSIVSMNISTLKTYTDLTLDNSYDDLFVHVYKKNNRNYSCIVKDFNALHAITLTDSEIEQFEKYFCKDEGSSVVIINPSNDYAMFASGPRINRIISKFGYDYFASADRSVQYINWCNDCSSMNMGYGLDSNYYDLFYDEDGDQFCKDEELSDCISGIPSTSKRKRIDISASDSPHKIYLLSVSQGKLYYYSDVNASNIYLNPDSSYMFNAGDDVLANLSSIQYLNNFNTSKCLNMSHMFDNTAFTSLDLGSWDTSKVKDISFIFANMSKLYSININGWNLSSLTKSNNVFTNTNALSSINTPNYVPAGYSITLPGTFNYHGNSYNEITITSPKGVWLSK